MVKALQAARAGGPEVLEYVDVEVGGPGPGEIRLRHGAIGVNYIDTYHRAGTYPGSGFPRVLGVEGAGEVTAIGEGVTTAKLGDRVCYPLGPGAYCAERLINAGMVVPVPDGISDEQAAAAITKGITVHHLYSRVRQVKSGDWVLFHAAAGGVGLFACQWAKHIGAKLIGTVSSDAKAKLARDNGAVETIDYTQEDFVARVKDITGGDGGRAGGRRHRKRQPDQVRPVSGGLRHADDDRSGRRPDDNDDRRSAGVGALHQGLDCDVAGAVGRVARVRRGVLRSGAKRCDQDFGQPHLCTEGRRAGAYRPAGTQDDGVDHPQAVTSA